MVGIIATYDLKIQDKRQIAQLFLKNRMPWLSRPKFQVPPHLIRTGSENFGHTVALWADSGHEKFL
jgi:hypothetical protein